MFKMQLHVMGVPLVVVASPADESASTTRICWRSSTLRWRCWDRRGACWSSERAFRTSTTWAAERTSSFSWDYSSNKCHIFRSILQISRIQHIPRQRHVRGAAYAYSIDCFNASAIGILLRSCRCRRSTCFAPTSCGSPSEGTRTTNSSRKN